MSFLTEGDSMSQQRGRFAVSHGENETWLQASDINGGGSLTQLPHVRYIVKGRWEGNFLELQKMQLDAICLSAPCSILYTSNQLL